MVETVETTKVRLPTVGENQPECDVIISGGAVSQDPIVQGKIVRDETNVSVVQAWANPERINGMWGEDTSLNVGTKIRQMQTRIGVEADGKITNSLLNRLEQEQLITRETVDALREMKKSGVLDQIYNRSLSAGAVVSLECTDSSGASLDVVAADVVPEAVAADVVPPTFIPFDLDAEPGVAVEAAVEAPVVDPLKNMADRVTALFDGVEFSGVQVTEGMALDTALMQRATTPEAAGLIADMSELSASDMTRLGELVEQNMAQQKADTGFSMDGAISFAADLVTDVGEGLQGLKERLADYSGQAASAFDNAVEAVKERAVEAGLLQGQSPEAGSKGFEWSDSTAANNTFKTGGGMIG